MTDIYPGELCVDALLPTSDQFSVTAVNGKVGKGVKSRIRVERGGLVSRFTGVLYTKVLQHTLQVSPDMHLHDPYFVGLLSHSCAPNCVLDMQHLEIRALAEIESGDLLTIDYAATEDVLYRQFPCTCGTANCRKWITGRRETINATGKAYLAGLAGRTVRNLVPRTRRGAR